MKAGYSLIFLIAMSCMVLSSCNKFGAARADDCEASLYPGELLESTTLNYYYNTGFSLHPGSVGMSFHMEIDNSNLKYEVLAKPFPGLTKVYRYCPNDEVFNSFGDDSAKVKEGYYSIVNYNQDVNQNASGIYQYTTIFSDGTLSLKANKRFAGFEAGEEISELAVMQEINPSPFPIEPPEGMIPLKPNIHIFILLEDREMFNEEVEMHLEIPVKVGMLLHTLQDRISDPEAPMQYRDEVLTCDFTIPKNLK